MEHPSLTGSTRVRKQTNVQWTWPRFASHSYSNTSTVRIRSGTQQQTSLSYSAKKANESHQSPALLCLFVQYFSTRCTHSPPIMLSLWLSDGKTSPNSASLTLAPIQPVWFYRCYNTMFHFSNFTVKNGLSELSWCCLICEGPDSVVIPSLLSYHLGSLASIYETHQFSVGPPCESSCLL